MLGQWIAERPMIGALVAAIVLGAAVSFLFRGRSESKTGERVYYYDLADGKLFEAGRSMLEDVIAPSGQAAPRAQVFACGECGAESDRFVGYLEQYTEAYRKAAREGDMAVINASTGMQVRSPEGDKWFASESPEARELLQGLAKRCTEKVKLTSCQP